MTNPNFGGVGIDDVGFGEVEGNHFNPTYVRLPCLTSSHKTCPDLITYLIMAAYKANPLLYCKNIKNEAKKVVRPLQAQESSKLGAEVCNGIKIHCIILAFQAQQIRSFFGITLFTRPL